MNTKLTLKVKEGPGELIGITQIDTNDGIATFDKIQFSESGRYIISIISSSQNIENTELAIDVVEQDEFIEQESNDYIEKKLLIENRPFITQIDLPTIDLEPMNIDVTTNNEDNDRLMSSFGINPFFWYNGIQIQERYINKLELYYEGIVPKAKVTFIDALGIINSNERMPLSDTKFEIFFNSRSNSLKSIHLRFKIEVNQINKNKTNTISGIIDIPEFYKIDYNSYNMSSFNTLRELCRNHKIGFNSNIEQTNDSMRWIRNGITTSDFMKNILEHSYISDTSFIQGYIDYYWSFNFVDIEKEWLRDISNDVGINSTGISSLSEDDLDSLVPLILTNDDSANYTGFGFTNYRINNSSTKKNSNKGTYTKVKYYDRIKKKFFEYNVDSLNENSDNKIILKGSPQDKSEMSNYRTSFTGKIDADNLHNNYLYASDQNKRNLINLTNITIEVEMYNPNFNLYRFQKIRVAFVNKFISIVDDVIINERLSGEWVIIDISYIYTKNVTKQKLVLARKDLNKLIEEVNNQVISSNSNTDNSEFNDNPFDDDITTQTQTITPSPILTPLQNVNSRTLSDNDIIEFSNQFNLEEAVVRAVIEVESSGSGFFSDGRAKILYEGHIFWRRLKGININPEEISNDSNQDILFPNWVNTFYLKGVNEYTRLERAKKLIPNNKRVSTSALESASWGLFQILGSNAISMGYPSVEDFVEKMQTSEKEHLIAFGRFINKNRLLESLRKKDWQKFARGYNGPQYTKNRYDEKLQQSYLKFSRTQG
jgi:hypothetical protein